MSPPPRPHLGLLVVGLGTLLAPLDTAVNIAFPSITRAFVLNLEDIRWVVIAYVLTYASLMLAFGEARRSRRIPTDLSSRTSDQRAWALHLLDRTQLCRPTAGPRPARRQALP